LFTVGPEQEEERKGGHQKKKESMGHGMGKGKKGGLNLEIFGNALAGGEKGARREERGERKKKRRRKNGREICFPFPRLSESRNIERKGGGGKNWGRGGRGGKKKETYIAK